MSFVPLKKILKKIFLIASLTVFLGIFFSAPAHAYSLGDFGKDFFSAGNQQGLSFTQYSGQLASLGTEGYDQSLVASTDLKEYIIKVVNFALGFLGLIAVLIVIYGGVLYVTAAGEDEKVGKAKKAIGYAAIGLLIVMGSFAFVNTIIKGGTGGADQTTGGATAITATQGFNASAEQVRSLAVQIYNGYTFLSESTNELQNIKNDAEKESLKPGNLPSKNAILTFLGSVGGKLNNMKSKVPSFSVTESKINEILRDLDKDIDVINKTGDARFLKITDAEKGTVEYCNVEEARTFWQGATGASDGDICHNKNYDKFYSSGLFEAW
ncbi:hypothetical protein HZA40_01300, partial [Candidatus Peregrinibacteria bacterium]|nr:hypothetical protein [Candidatus Peregrinibacteria bacterium]